MPRYWKSVDHLEGNPAFERFVEDEFPSRSEEWLKPVNRREVMRLMAASFALAGFQRLYPSTEGNHRSVRETTGRVHARQSAPLCDCNANGRVRPRPSSGEPPWTPNQDRGKSSTPH